MKKRIIPALLLAAAVLSLGAAALADDGISQEITLTAPAAQLSVTVPTSLAAELSYDGNGKVSGTATSEIRNNSALPVTVKYKIDKSDDITVKVGETTLQKDTEYTVENITEGATKNVTYNISCDAAATWLATNQKISVTYTVDWAKDI